ncbi:MAG: hypothetical protein ACRDD8_04715 [Bacteroidales bacterium]
MPKKIMVYWALDYFRILYSEYLKVDFRSWMIYFLDRVHDYDTDYTVDIAELLPDKLRSAGIL